jgi:hypothetical protein
VHVRITVAPRGSLLRESIEAGDGEEEVEELMSAVARFPGR